MPKQILVERKGRIVHVTLNRPRKGNLMSSRMKEIVTDTVDSIGGDDKTCAIVLRGNGKDFCHGREQKLPGGPAKDAFDLHTRAMSKILAVYEAFRRCPVPIISVVHGKALGFGCALVGGSDVAYASTAARFALPEMAHGTAPTLAMAALSKVAPKTLCDLVYSREEIDAEAAQRTGLVSRIFEPDELENAVETLLERLSAYDPTDIKTVKRFLLTGPQLHPDIMSDLAGYTLATVRSRGR
ncbi:MAG: enoyl-CoA hydratase/isomerase family protein [Pseudomonadota bacterium]